MSGREANRAWDRREIDKTMLRFFMFSDEFSNTLTGRPMAIHIAGMTGVWSESSGVLDDEGGVIIEARDRCEFEENRAVAFVGIPHKEAAVRCCDEVHPLAKSIGAVNTIVRRPMDGNLIERQVNRNGAFHGTSSPISRRSFVLIGAGGAGRAMAFGAKYKGARIVIFNRNYERAKALADAVSGEALPYETLEKFRPETGAILANYSAIGMEPNSDQSPVSKEALRAYDLVFYAVYTPRITRLLKEAAEVGVAAVSSGCSLVAQHLKTLCRTCNETILKSAMLKLEISEGYVGFLC
ncbi:bifunctional 3-dehydroquinate dehydratase/shikimate dehydrogenase, chloroplastic-like [Hibiscus syriacus]|uniref:bifunctional 3-dehydroquinate dehydratase/shikimate dehydrogenase, chloroplastic-like n=1 Tax=Hibiscus syriacus TaxID=106335 RepID=UPI001920B7C2|nr:bifunctional 3-dehydroquinate dehydratase/shikimate dehydrogenase, chloroplastic-like [Hibiscus syriacus]